MDSGGIINFVLMVLGVTPQTTTLKGEEQVDSNLPYTFVYLGGYGQVPLEPPTLVVTNPPVLTTPVSDNAKIQIIMKPPKVIGDYFSGIS